MSALVELLILLAGLLLLVAGVFTFLALKGALEIWIDSRRKDRNR